MPSMLSNFLRLSAAALAVATLATAPAAAQQRFDGVTLRVATFGGVWRDIMDKELSPKFAALGGKLEFITGSPQVNFAKLIAARGRPPFDVMEILDAQTGDFAKTDFLLPIDYSKIPNGQYLSDFQKQKMLIASWATQEGICYNVDKYKELGLPAPTTYKDLANPALVGKVMIPDINSGGGLAGFGAIAYAAGGDEKNVAPGVELIKSLKTLKFWAQGDQVVLSFQSGDIVAAVAHTGWCLRTFKQGQPVAAVHPTINAKTTGVSKDGWLGVIKGTPNEAAATWFLNQYVDADYQLTFSIVGGVVPVNTKAIERMGEDPVFAKMMQLKPDQMAHQLHIDYTKVNIPDWVDQWNRMVVK